MDMQAESHSMATEAPEVCLGGRCGATTPPVFCFGCVMRRKMHVLFY